ncbi:MAG: DUF2516 family protein [Aeromicrobium sp.]|uniref:DUF2516 family protein n=1 Tax=Aeromicrobium sp. TaxID=1871063 RepID=UPI003C5924B0
MLDFAGVQGGISLVLTVVLLVVKGFALVDCLGRSPSSFLAHDTLPKRSWTIILVLALLAHIVFPGPLSVFNLIGTVAALVYLAQLRGSSL